MSTFVRNGIVKNGLVFYVDAANKKSYPGSGNNWYDLSGNGHTGSFKNSLIFDNEYGGGLIATQSNWCQLTPLNIDYPFNISIITQGKLSGDPIGGAITFSSPTLFNRSVGTGINTTLQQAVAYYYSSGTGYVQVVAEGVISEKVYVVSANYTTASIELYVNGQYKNRLIQAQAKQWNETASSYNISKLERSSTDTYYTGVTYSGMVYNRTLSAKEILQNYNALKNRFNLT